MLPCFLSDLEVLKDSAIARYAGHRMLFNSYSFIFLFLPVAFVGMFWLGRYSNRLAALWLGLASLIFYGVYFANTPYVSADNLHMMKVEESAREFSARLSELAPVLDSKVDLLFSKSLFFNTDLHLNSDGRRIRTALLASALRRNGNFALWRSEKHK